MTIRHKINKPLLSFKSFVCLIIISLFLFPAALSAYDFSDVRRSLKKDVNLWRPESSRNKIAIVYNYSDHNRIKQQFNLIKLKKDLSHELAKSFEVADPIIVQQVISSNNLSYGRLSDDRYLFKEFTDRVGCSLALMVDLNLRNDLLAGNMTLMDSKNTQISRVDMEIPDESEELDLVPIQNEDPEESFFNTGFASPFAEKQTDSWMYFAPSAMIGTNRHSLNLSVSFRDIAEVDVQPTYLKYDISFAETIQFGVQSYALSKKIEDKGDIMPRANLASSRGHHSTYISAKYLIVNRDIMPVNIALGLRGRVAWDEDNIEFNSAASAKDKEKAEEIDEDNKRLNALTLQAMLSGEVENLGLMYNFYVDNQTAAAGAKIFVLPSVRLMGDFIYYFYEDPVVKSDFAFGVQVINKLGVAGLNYQWETAQVQFEMTFNF